MEVLMFYKNQKVTHAGDPPLGHWDRSGLLRSRFWKLHSISLLPRDGDLHQDQIVIGTHGDGVIIVDCTLGKGFIKQWPPFEQLFSDG